MIILKDIYKDYKLGRTKVEALKDINLEFNANEFVCIHGPSGCGKTTLLNIIGGLDVYTKGRLIIDGQDTINFKDNDWDSYRNQKIGFVFQNYYLLPQLNVFENIEIALELINLDKEKRIEKVNKALERVGLLDQSLKMPNQLSGGQIQRVAIARAIVNEPTIVLADEPTGALDSKNAKVIMEILKEISNERLVILVSHNLELAKEYATRVVEMLDGRVIATNQKKYNNFKKQEYKIQKTSMSFFTSFKISFRNLLRTKLRTPLIIFAGCIGMIGIGLVLSIARGVNIYIEDVQRSALVSYPIRLSSSPKVLDDSGKEKQPLERFPDTDYINVIKGEIKRDYYNVIDGKFINYLDELDKSLYSLINYNRRIKMNMIAKNPYNDTYQNVFNSYFYEMTEDIEFMEKQYDRLYGEFPSNPYELALLISDRNSLDASILSSLNIDFTEDTIEFSEIIGTEYRIIDNDDYYLKIGEKYYQNSNREQLYENSTTSLKITAIIRPKKNADANIYTNGILYSKELTDLIYENNLNSLIAKEQLEYKLEKDVFQNKPFEEYVSTSVTYSPMYQYEENLIQIGVIPQITGINIYTEKFHDRLLIKDYIESYVDDEAKVNISFNDYMNNVTNEFSELVRVFSTVLIIFSSVSLVVSSIMIGIITYVSILQRTKEIGLLRSIGARKRDIARLFNVETLIIGFASGIFGIIGVLILLDPVNNFVRNMVTQYTVSFRGVESVIVAKFELIYMVILLVGSMVLSLLSGFIPAIMASRKSPIDALRNER